eukprot:3654567-Amphidinium_carterae.1
MDRWWGKAKRLKRLKGKEWWYHVGRDSGGACVRACVLCSAIGQIFQAGGWWPHGASETCDT